MMRNRIFLLIMIPIIITLSACQIENTEDDYKVLFQEHIDRYPNLKAEKLYEEEIPEGYIVLFRDETDFRYALYSDSQQYWVTSGNAELNPDDGLSWTMYNGPRVPVSFAGVLTDDEIVKVVVKQRTLQNEAKIVTTDQGYRVWYTTFDVLEEGSPDPLKVEAMDENGKVLWKHGVYEDGIYSGRTDN